jgi:hypothetical protein
VTEVRTVQAGQKPVARCRRASSRSRSPPSPRAPRRYHGQDRRLHQGRLPGHRPAMASWPTTPPAARCTCGPDPGGRRRRQRQAFGHRLQRPRQVLFNLGIDNVSESGNKAGAFFEMDFFGNSLGNQTATNTYGRDPAPRLHTGTTGWPARPGPTSWTRPRCRKRSTSSAPPTA